MATFIATNTTSTTTTSNGFEFPGTDDELLVPLNVLILASSAGFVGVTGPGGGTVQNNGRILGYDAGISLGAQNQTTTILNFAAGTIGSSTGSAIVAVATGASGNVDIQNAGIVNATAATISAISVDGAGQIVNNGLITSAGIGISQLGSVATTSLFSLVNGITGTIVGGYVAEGSLVTEQILNGGLINGDLVLGDGDGASFTNQATGSITDATVGSVGAVIFGDGDDGRFLNLGTMGALTWGSGNQAYGLNYGTMGGITLGDGDGAFFGNAGTIDGHVQLGNGTGQVFDSRAGWIRNTASPDGAGSITAGSTGATIVGALNGGRMIGGAGDDVLIANPTQQMGYSIVATLDGGGGSNALYGGQGTNLFLSGNATHNQIWGGAAAFAANGYSNNTVDYAAVTGAGRGIYVDLLNGHNAYIVDNGAYTLVDSISNVPNVKGSAGVDIIQAGADPGTIEGRGGGDQLYTGTGATTFKYTSYQDSNLLTGYDTIVGFQSGTDKIDVSALGQDYAHVVIESDATNTVVYFQKDADTFNAATDLAISVTGANALAPGDITFASSTPNGRSFYDYNSYYGTGYPDPSLMPTGTTPFSDNINVGLVLERAFDPTRLLESDWGTRQKALALLGDDPFSVYGARHEDYNDLISALDSLGIVPSTNPAYVSSAHSRTVWVSLTPEQFTSLFGQTLLVADAGGIYWNGNLALNAAISSLGTVKGLSFDIDYIHSMAAVIGANGTVPDGTLPDGTVPASTYTIPPGPQGQGNGANGGSPVAVDPQIIAERYNFPLHSAADVRTGKLGLIEPGMGSDTFDAMNSTIPNDDYGFAALLDGYREAIGLPGDVIVVGQQQGGTLSSGADTSERSLDVGVATAINPNSTLALYAGSGTADNAGASVFTAYQSAFFDRDPASVVSSSFRFTAAQAGVDSPFLWAARELMIDAALRNITVFQSSGDGGSSYALGNGLTNTSNARASEYSVIVGGTSTSTVAVASGDPTLNGQSTNPAFSNILGLAQEGDLGILWQLVAGGLKTPPSTGPDTGTDGDWFVETVWNHYNLVSSGVFDPSYTNNDAGNGGVDYTQLTPWYQSALLPFAPPVTTDSAHVTGRGVPDVAALASGNTYYSVPQADLLPVSGSWTRGVGGTSAATPLWASLALQINAVFEDQHLPALGYMTDLLYIAAAVAPASFNDVTIGNNNSSYVESAGALGLTATNIGYAAGPGYDLASGLGSPNGLLLARALTAIAQSQMNYSETVPDVADLNGGSWEAGTRETLLVQTTLHNPAGVASTTGGAVSVSAGDETLDFISRATDAYAWTSRFAGQVEHREFHPDLMLLFDGQQQGALHELTVEAGDALSVAINGSQASGSAGLLTSDFGFIDFQTADGSTVRLARPVAVAETVHVPTVDPDQQPDGTAIVRLRQSGTDALAVRFYKVDDYTGAVGGMKPGDAGYAAAALAAAYTLTSGGSVSDPTSATGPGHGQYGEATFQVRPGDIIAMQLQNITTGNTYWAFSQANETAGGQPVGHLWNYGLNTWGWEAGAGGGDHDFNDLVVQLDFTSAYGHGYLMN
jgi:hypothetical protein